MKKYVVGTCGYYGDNVHKGDGQIIRTATVTRALSENINKKNIKILSYYMWKKNPLALFLRYTNLFRISQNVILFPDSNAYRIMIRYAVMIKRMFHTKVYYNVIGGWLPSFLEKDNAMIQPIARLDGLFVQTKEIKKRLGALGITKVFVFPNFKYVHTYDDPSEVYNLQYPLKTYYMSRINHAKGIEEMVATLKRVNHNKVKYTLDIYGQPDDDYIDRFDRLCRSFPDYITYKGIAEHDRTTEISHSYFMQLFPTKMYETEGFPGSVLDAFYAGVPVLASRWSSCDSVINDGVDGVVFKFGDYSDMQKKLEFIYDNPQRIVEMRKQCALRGKQYAPEQIIRIMCDELRV